MKKLLLCLFALLAVGLAHAQSDRGRIMGTITDSSGSVLPRVQVTAISKETNSSRQVNSDAGGHYVFTDLLPMTYTITAKASGFSNSTVEGIALAVGQERNVDLRMQVEGLQQTVVVDSGAETQLDTSTATAGGLVSTREVDNLPLNGRMMSQLYILIPGASMSGAGTFDDMRFSGHSNEQNTIRYDGIQAGTLIDSNPADVNGASTSQFRLSQSLESVQEFNVATSNYDAEYGRGTGGQVTVITKSGSNELHGGLFEYLRNDWFDARNAYNTKPSKAAPLRLNQFGGTVGGPILRDKLFFFIGQENLMQRVYVNFTQNTPNAAARARAVPSIVPVLNAAFPVGQTHIPNSEFDIFSGTFPSYVNEYFGNVRIDYHINSANSVYLRYSRDQGYANTPSDGSGSSTLQTSVPQNSIIDWTSVLRPSLINDLKVGYNAAKTRVITQGVVVPGLDLSDQTFSIGGAAQSGATGIITPTGAGSAPLTHGQPYTNYEWEFIDNLTWVHNTHSFKFGTEINPRFIYVDQLGGIVYTYTNLDTFLQNTPTQVHFDGDLAESPSPFHNGATGTREGLQQFYGFYAQDQWKLKPNLTMNYGVRYDYYTTLRESRNLGVTVNTLAGTIDPAGTPFYAVSKLNIGPRLSFAWLPKYLNGNTVLRIGAGYYYGPGQEEDQIQPILNDVADITLTTGPINYPVDRATLLKNFNPNSPNANYQPRVYGPNYQLPEKVLDYTASIEQTLPDRSVFTLSYVGSQGRNMFLRGIANLMTSVTTTPGTGVAVVNRQFGNRFAELDVKTTGGADHYDSLQANWNRRFARGLTGVANWTWSHSIGNTNGSNEATTSQNNYEFSGERGNNSSDERHVINFATLYDLPFGRGRAYNFSGNRLLDTFLGGWNLGGIFNFHTGIPINITVSRANALYYDTANGHYYTNPVVTNGQVRTVGVVNIPGGGNSRGTQRPNRVPGVNPFLKVSATTGAPVHYAVNPAAFSLPMPGTYGNLSRDAFYGPSFGQLDLTTSKQFILTERVKLSLRADAYNILNHPNFSNPPVVLGAGVPSSPANETASTLQPGQAFTSAFAGSAFGALNATVGKYINMGTSRQLQLALRLTF